MKSLNLYEVLFENMSGEYGVLLLGRGKILHPSSTMVSTETGGRYGTFVISQVMDWYCFSFRMSLYWHKAMKGLGCLTADWDAIYVACLAFAGMSENKDFLFSCVVCCG